jgi:DNA primase
MQQEFDAVDARHRRQAAVRPEAGPTRSAGSGATLSVMAEHELLMLCLHFETLGKPLSHAIQHDWIDQGHVAGVLLNRFLAEFEQDAWPGRNHLDGLLETPEERALVATLMFETPDIDDPVKVAQEGLRQLRTRALEPRLRQIELALANLGADSDSDPISLLKERLELQRQLRMPFVLAAAV